MIKIRTISFTCLWLIAISLFLAMCGQTPSSTSPGNTGNASAPQAAAGGQSGYLAVGKIPGSPDGVFFIQWTEVNGNLNGQIQSATLNNDGIKTNSTAITGLHSGSGVSLTINGFSGVGQNLSGTIEGSKLTLMIPDNQTGQLIPFVLQSATINDYNTAITALQSQRATQVADAPNATATAIANNLARLDGKWENTGPDFAILEKGKEIKIYEFHKDGTFALPEYNISGTYEFTPDPQKYKEGKLVFHWKFNGLPVVNNWQVVFGSDGQTLTMGTTINLKHIN